MKAVNYKKVVCGVSLGTVMVLGSMSSAFAADNNHGNHTTTTTQATAAHSHTTSTTTTTTPAEAAHSHSTSTTTTTTPAEAAHSHTTTTTTTTTPAEAAHSHGDAASTVTVGAAPTLSAVAGTATLPTATYFVRYTYVTDKGETAASAESSLAITLGQDLQIVVPALPSHATSINIYISSSTNTETLQVNTTSTTYDQSLPLVTGVSYPTTNTIVSSHSTHRR
jgi:hypothetical protein